MVILIFAQSIGKFIFKKDLLLKVDGLHFFPYSDTPVIGIVSEANKELFHHYQEHTFINRNIQGKIFDGKKEGI